MDYKTIWKEICFHVNRFRNAPEQDFQTVVELLFEKLGWSLVKGEVVSQITIPVGSSNSVRPDMVLKNDGKTVLVVELKRANVNISERNAEQLISYMRLLRLDFGILLGESLQIYYELPSGNSPVKVCDIRFVDGSETGVECIEVLSKNDFSFERLTEFCNKCLADQKRYYEEQQNKTIHNLEKAYKENYPLSSSKKVSTIIVIDGFENKNRPRRILYRIPDDFYQTDELVDVIAWNGWESKRARVVWKRKDTDKKFVIDGKNEFQILEIIGVHESGKFMIDRFYINDDHFYGKIRQ